MTGISPIVWVLLAVIVVLVILYFNKQKTANASVAAAASNYVEPCTPFTQAQQDAEKRKKKADCANKLLIPFVGQVQYYACIKNVDSTLTPVKNC